MSEIPGCGAPAAFICFRGKTRRAFFCGECRPLYAGSGKVAPYQVGEDTPETRVPGIFTGPARRCGEEVL